MLARKREAKAKLELAAKNDKVPQARQEVLEWEAKVERGQEEFDNVSRVIRTEMDRFELNRIADFRNSVVRYFEFLLDTQQQVGIHIFIAVLLDFCTSVLWFSLQCRI